MMRARAGILAILLTAMSLLGGPSAASAVVPPPGLQGWEPWVTDQQAFRRCPLQAGQAGNAEHEFDCAWPGVLDVQASAGGARFEQRWTTYAEAWVPLPGSEAHWPQQVRVNGAAVAVVSRSGRPTVRLNAGEWRIEGELPWTQRPQSIAVPLAVGLVRLSVDGQPIAPVQRNDEALVLGRGASTAPEADALDLRVLRRLDDGLPAQLETRIELRVAGQAREIVLGPVLPPGWVATAIDVDMGWPARVDAEGRLRVQAQPDTAVIALQARAVAPLESVELTAAPAPWPAQEIWSYAPAPSLRVSAATGATQVDPAQAGVPGEWQELPAFALEAGKSLAIEERSRGIGDNADDRLSLERTLWLDFSGEGWTLLDDIDGTMRRGWRFDALAPLALQNVEDNNEGTPLLVTAGEGDRRGVEWRSPIVALVAGSRIEPAAHALPVTGWNTEFDAVDTTLNLPHGWRLLAAPGADEATGTWVARWTLLDLFISAVLALFAWRLMGAPGAALAVGYLVLSRGESGAPLWTLGAVLAIALVSKALPEGRLLRIARGLRTAALVLMALVAVPFVADQLRLALHPQLEGAPSHSRAPVAEPAYEYAEAAADAVAAVEMAPAPVPEPPAAALAPIVSDSSKRQTLDSITVTGSRIRQSDILGSYSSSAVTQAGRGIPVWRGGSTHRLSWRGPITAEQSVRLWLLPPWATRALRVVGVLLLAVLVLRLAGKRLPLPGLRPAAPAAAALLLSFGFAGALSPNAAVAQATPAPETLAEWSQRMARPPACAPTCVGLSNARIEARGDGLSVVLDAQALTASTLPIPEDPTALAVTRVQLDGQPMDLALRSRGALQIALPRGAHRVQIDYAIRADRIALAFGMTPRRVEFSGEGWQPSGIADGRLLTETLRLSRVREASAGTTSAVEQEFPPYVRVVREVSLGLDWTVRTRVERIAPDDGGFSVVLPLLDGEKVLTPGARVREGGIEVAIADGEGGTEWSSTLDKDKPLRFEAPSLEQRAEVWTFVVSPMWRAVFDGVPESVSDGENADDWHRFRFDPVPGEALAVGITRPEAIAGETQAIEGAQLTTRVGERATEHALEFALRATQGGERVIQLPEAAVLIAVERDGETLGLRLEAGRLSLPVQPGEQEFRVRFRESEGTALTTRTAAVDLGLHAANIDLQLDLPEGRWLLAASGPQAGPAVLYWGELLVVVLVALGLGRLGGTPLRTRDWLLLGIGFSTFSWWALAVVVAWIYAVAWRERHGAALDGRWRFDGLQLGLIALTVAAALALIAAIPFGLLGQPDMHVAGQGSSASSLRWFADQAEAALPVGSAVSVPLWIYRIAMLAWSLWLANAVVSWLRWALRAWMAGGYWRALRTRKVEVGGEMKGEEPPPIHDEAQEQ
jgi:hypothetical protein